VERGKFLEGIYLFARGRREKGKAERTHRFTGNFPFYHSLAVDEEERKKSLRDSKHWGEREGKRGGQSAAPQQCLIFPGHTHSAKTVIHRKEKRKRSGGRDGTGVQTRVSPTFSGQSVYSGKRNKNKREEGKKNRRNC